ncbi:MAG TPA: DUF362 domain-containing protein [Vicinamibacterales bacterium]|nr:DUF362 domain-containing protein [Vicinamibacterales bacterium]HPK72615.1 DUF362 domain-containing protein [Vicinamibacterales bacterium]
MQKPRRYQPMLTSSEVTRREFVRAGAASAVVGGIVLGVPSFAASDQDRTPPPAPETNINDFMKVPKGKHALPGPFPGRVVEVKDARSLADDAVDGKVVAEMFERGVRTLTGKDMSQSFALLFEPGDVVGIKVNPVGPPLIHTKVELAQAVVRWLMDNKVPAGRIVIWDRFDYMLKEAGYTPDRFPKGVRIEGLQTMDETGNGWRDAAGNHVSTDRFDKDAYYFAKGIVGRNVRGYKNDEFYLNQHVFNGEYSYFGKLLTKDVTRLVNLAAYKNTGAGISMATKNLGYGAVCNTGRLHAPLFFTVCTEVLAAPAVREKLVLNVIDGLRGQYDGGPDKNAQFVYPNHSLYFATDPFALDMCCHRQLMAKRKEMGIAVNEHPRFTEYLHYAERLGLGVANPEKIDYVRVQGPETGSWAGR